MADPIVHPAAPMEGRSIPAWRSVLHAIANERALDLNYRERYTDLGQDRTVPNYKVMKQLALRRQFGRAYRPCVKLAPWAIPVLAVLQWAADLAGAMVGRSTEWQDTLFIVATSPGNLGLIEAVIAIDGTAGAAAPASHVLTHRDLLRSAGWVGVARCIGAHVRLLAHIVIAESALRADLLLHARDAMHLLLLVRFARAHATSQFVTDDHYQRWAFLLSHHCRNLAIVQHGFIDPDIRFPHRFGTADTVYLRDSMFGPAFAAYYSVATFTTFESATRLTSHPLSDTAVFLASSFPSIDTEIRFLTAIKAQRKVAVMVKFHPAHAYDARKNDLSALADHVCGDGDMPACRVFVSHSSFMEFDYKARGIATFSIARAGGAEAAAQAVLAFLDQPVSPPAAGA